jgi:hypothetical protein
MTASQDEEKGGARGIIYCNIIATVIAPGWAHQI